MKMSEIIQRAIKNSGHKAEYIASLAGVTESYISKIVNDKVKTPPAFETIERIATALNMPENERQELLRMAALERTPDLIKEEIVLREGEYELYRRISSSNNITAYVNYDKEYLQERVNKGDYVRTEYELKWSNNFYHDVFKRYIDFLQTSISNELYRLLWFDSCISIMKTYRIQQLESETKPQTEANGISNASIVPASEMSKIPVYSYVMAGVGVCCDFPEPEYYIDLPYIKNGHNVAAITVKGNSMEPRLFEGDLVLVRVGVQPEVRQTGVFIYNSETVVKIYNVTSKGQTMLTSHNPEHLPVVIEENDEFHIVGKVFKVVQDYK